MNKDNVQALQDVILGYLGMTRDELEAQILNAEAVIEDELDGWDNVPDEIPEEVADFDRIKTLGNVIDNLLVNLEGGTIKFEHAKEVVDIVAAVSHYEQLVRSYA